MATPPARGMTRWVSRELTREGTRGGIREPRYPVLSLPSWAQPDRRKNARTTGVSNRDNTKETEARKNREYIFKLRLAWGSYVTDGSLATAVFRGSGTSNPAGSRPRIFTMRATPMRRS